MPSPCICYLLRYAEITTQQAACQVHVYAICCYGRPGEVFKAGASEGTPPVLLPIMTAPTHPNSMSARPHGSKREGQRKKSAAKGRSKQYIHQVTARVLVPTARAAMPSIQPFPWYTLLLWRASIWPQPTKTGSSERIAPQTPQTERRKLLG
jgi:hypothetical protein